MPFYYPHPFLTPQITKSIFMKQNRTTYPAGLSYYGLYLLDYLRTYHPDKVSDTEFIRTRGNSATEVFEQTRKEGGTVEAAQEEAMRMLLAGLHFSPYALLLEVAENEFPEEVPEEERETFCLGLYPYLKNLLDGYNISNDNFALSPDCGLLYTELTGTVMLYLEAHGV